MPTLINTQVETKALQGQNFPLIFKICPLPAFRDKAVFREVGYKTTHKYFLGRSMYNESIYGWAGHRNDSSGPLSTVDRVYNKVSMFRPEDIIQSINIEFNDASIEKLNRTHVLLKRVNYAMNCFALNLDELSEKIKEKGVKTMTFYFKLAANLTRVQINAQGFYLASYRDFFDHSFYSFGDAVVGEPGYFAKYGFEISENIFVEHDPSKNCQVYPTSQFETFGDCDYQYMVDLCEKAEVTPIWLEDDFENVSKYFTFQGPLPGKFGVKMFPMMTNKGYTKDYFQ